MLDKFHERKGPHENLPQWISCFARDVQVEFENLRSKLRDQEANLTARSQSMLDKMVENMKLERDKDSNNLHSSIMTQLDSYIDDMRSRL